MSNTSEFIGRDTLRARQDQSSSGRTGRDLYPDRPPCLPEDEKFVDPAVEAARREQCSSH